jgi:hypothetical protein
MPTPIQLADDASKAVKQAAGTPSHRAEPGTQNDSGTDTDEDGALIQKVRSRARRFCSWLRGAHPRHGEQVPSEIKSRLQPKEPKKKPPGRKAGAITLKLLIDEGYLSPAAKILTVEYRGSTTYGELKGDGRIGYEGGSTPRWASRARATALVNHGQSWT